MLKLEKSEYRKIARLFEGVANSKPVIFSVIDGNIDGEVFADNDTQPLTALVVLYDMLFFASVSETLDYDDFYRFINERVFPSVKEGYVDFYCYADRRETERVFGQKTEGRPVRKTFALDRESFSKHNDWRDKIPDGCKMEFIDVKFVSERGLDKNFWEPESKRFGYALTCDGKIISECTAVFVGSGMAEVSVSTEEPYRGRGFAALTCAAFIEYCLKTGLEPNWGCWDFRTASAALAKKLGFVETSDFVVYGIKK